MSDAGAILNPTHHNSQNGSTLRFGSSPIFNETLYLPETLEVVEMEKLDATQVLGTILDFQSSVAAVTALGEEGFVCFLLDLV